MNHKKHLTPLWEKLVGILGLILLCAGFFYLSWVKITAGESPPEILFRVNNVVPLDSSFLVNVTVRNRGFQTVTALQVQGVLQVGDEEERNKLAIDYLPANSTRDIGFFFKSDPREGALEFKALGFQAP